jgi:hypothetical protein
MDTWKLEVLESGRVRARCTEGENAGEILEWASPAALIEHYRDMSRMLGNVAKSIGLVEAWQNS